MIFASQGRPVNSGRADDLNAKDLLRNFQAECQSHRFVLSTDLPLAPARVGLHAIAFFF